MIKLTNVDKQYTDHHALNQVSVTFPEHQTTVILGPSGAGKSTLLRTINLLERPQAGQLTIGEQTVDFSQPIANKEVLALRRKTAMVFQSWNLFPHLTILQNITAGPIHVLKQDKAAAEAVALKLLKQVGLEETAHRYPGQLSGGQQQRISICRALAMNPEYILFDDCYMATVEVAYDLRHVTGHLIASTCEMMAYGMPYAEIGQYLLGDTDYEAICQEFYDFYSTYSTPCGTLSVTDCSRLDELAALMYEINTRCEYEGRAEEELQDLDGYRPTIFFDFGDYVRHLCDDVQLTATFEELLVRTVTCKTHTGQYYTSLSGAGTDGSGAYPIHTFSGLTISDPSTGHPLASVTDRNNTAWYQATH